MSETSSDAESSCGWTIISNEGSDIEMLGFEATVESGGERFEGSTVEKVESQKSQAAVESATDSRDTLGDQMFTETPYIPEVEDFDARKEQLLLSSDHSDIVTLGDQREGEQAGEATSSEDLYLGTSCSSHYAFTSSDAVYLVQQPAVTNSSSSEDEADRSAGTAMRRRRVRKNTVNIGTEEDEEVLPESLSSECEEKEKMEKVQELLEEPTELKPAESLKDRERDQGSSVLTKCVVFALVVAVSMGFGHFCATVQIQERQKNGEQKMGMNEVDRVIYRHVREHITNQSFGVRQGSSNEQEVYSFLSEIIEKIKQENKKPNVKQAQRDNVETLLKETTKKQSDIVDQQQSLVAENRHLKMSLKREERSLSILQQELRNLQANIKDLEATEDEMVTLRSENQRLKEQLEEDKVLIQDFHLQRVDLIAEVQMLRRKLEKERRLTEELRREVISLQSHFSEAGEDKEIHLEELQMRLIELEKKLSYEQQRSDLWERLYVETKEERAKGDRESRVKKTKEGMAKKVKETFDAVKNSTKAFVHHHKEQIKKAKEVVKENLRKFSDSVKSTFRHFRNSASTFINKARGFYDKKYNKNNPEYSWQHKPHHGAKPDFFQTDHNTRKSGEKVYEDQAQKSHRTNMKGCTGVYDCAYQESMNLFNKAVKPIRAEEFYQLLESYLQQEVDHFNHWKELEMFINNFFCDGVFIHDQMLFTDFISGLEDYLIDMNEYNGLDDDVFGDLDDYIYRHFFGEAYLIRYGPRGPFEMPEELRGSHKERKQQQAKPRTHSDHKWSRSGRKTDRRMPDVKIELGPMPFDPKF